MVLVKIEIFGHRASNNLATRLVRKKRNSLPSAALGV